MNDRALDYAATQSGRVNELDRITHLAGSLSSCAVYVSGFRIACALLCAQPLSAIFDTRWGSDRQSFEIA
jgi:hypothetical protein